MNHSTELDAGTVTRVVSFWRQWAATPDVTHAVSLIEVGGERFVYGPERLRGRLANTNFTVDALVDALGDEIAEVVGEARLAYGDAGSLCLVPTTGVETIDNGDMRLARLRDTVDADEWDEAGMDEPGSQRFAMIDDGMIVATTNVRYWGTTFGHIGAFTAPTARRRGLAAAVGSAAANHCVEAGLVPQWRSRTDNVASARAADRLGFVAVGRQIHARVRPVDSADARVRALA